MIELSNFKLSHDVGVMKKNGFTLMELIVADRDNRYYCCNSEVPRFLNIQESAREAVLEGVAGAMEASNTQVTSKAITGLTLMHQTQETA
ncbi:hypothetical protein OH492_18085 [Vibrio chagasii]|nr:hypothetical protein [Vibrio chagasii]